MCEVALRVEAPITNHLRDFAPNLEKYKAVHIFPFRKIELRRTVNFSVIVLLKLNML
jgi:hypothetical protein